MLLRVDLADHTGYWRFPGTLGFTAWLAECPWLADGGACVLRLPGRSDGFAFAEAACRTVYGWDAGNSHPRVEVLEGAEVQAGVREGVARRFGVSSEASAWQVREALSMLFAERPTVLVVTPPDGGRGCCDLWQEAAALRDEMAKTAFGAALTWILSDNATVRLDARLGFDFTWGQPVFGLFDSPGTDESRLWNSYLHARLAWEAAGDPALAAAMIGGMPAAISIGRDDRLEAELNAWADAALAVLPEDVIIALQLFLDSGKDDGGRLASHGLLWRPPGSRHLTPAPWVARALLLGAPAGHPRCWLLRAALVCVPLVNELLGRCQELEQRIKAECSGLPPYVGQDLPEDIAQLWERFRSGDDETTVYPTGHPSPPVKRLDAWQFASLGQFLLDPRSPLCRRSSRSELTLSRLRNTLAHGHYVCWAHVIGMQRILDALAGRR
jgi:hypothetical protein